MSAITYLRDTERAAFSARYPESPRAVRDCAVRALVAPFGESFVCTRRIGHDGPHVAHGGQGEALAWWGAQPADAEVVS